jgi:hypothetical protein
VLTIHTYSNLSAHDYPTITTWAWRTELPARPWNCETKKLVHLGGHMNGCKLLDVMVLGAIS